MLNHFEENQFLGSIEQAAENVFVLYSHPADIACAFDVIRGRIERALVSRRCSDACYNAVEAAEAAVNAILAEEA